MYACARTLVYAAEQLYRTGRILDKLKYVETELEMWDCRVDRASEGKASVFLTADVFLPFRVR